jgi:hypothetical protein
MPLAIGASLATSACERPKAPPKPVYISVEKGGEIRFSDNVPPELRAKILKAAKVTK